MAGFVEATRVVSAQALRLLETVDNFVSIPGVGAAAKVALGILSLAQSNRKELVRLGEKACITMTTIVQKVNAAEQPNRNIDMSSLEKDCRNLVFVMKDVETIIKKCVDRGLVGRILNSQSDTGIIHHCHARLDTVLKTFQVQNHIETRQGVDRMNDQLDRLVDRDEGAHQTFTQYAVGSTYSSTENNSVVVTGAGNSVNVSTVAPPPMHCLVPTRR